MLSSSSFAAHHKQLCCSGFSAQQVRGSGRMKRWTEADGKPEVSRTSMEEISVTSLSNFSCVMNWCIFLDGIWYSNSKPKSCGYIPLHNSYVTGTLQSSDLLIFLLETCTSNLMASICSFFEGALMEPQFQNPLPSSQVAFKLWASRLWHNGQ